MGAENSEADVPLKLLSLGKTFEPVTDHKQSLLKPLTDGGGIRGISTLIILKYLMKRINPKNPPKPCDYFDLIGGTSTGG
jgi:patatin-like phospholipase/acyl hydrolase